jgi:hypothetical protein
VVESTRLEIWRSRKVTVGSNPTLSAMHRYGAWLCHWMVGPCAVMVFLFESLFVAFASDGAMLG